METIQIFGFLFLIILLEIITDSVQYLSGTDRTKKWYGPLHHGTQLLMIPIIFLFGYLYEYSLWDLKTVYLILTYTMFHFAFFDFGYNWITGNTIIGTTSLWDRFLHYLLDSKSKLLKIIGKILTHTFIRLLIAFAACVILSFVFH
jgi:hypothetical protein